jgi:hypothetical protein
MTRATFTIAVAFLCTTAAAPPLVTYESSCECRDNHGKHRWAERNDPAVPPTDAGTIQAVTPSDVFDWQGPTEYLVPSSERIWSEQRWDALTGRVVDLRAEEDRDLHIALADASGDKGHVPSDIPRARVVARGNIAMLAGAVKKPANLFSASSPCCQAGSAFHVFSSHAFPYWSV